MKKLLLYLPFLALICACKPGNSSSPLVDLRSAGADFNTSSNTVTGTITILDKYNTPAVIVGEIIGYKSYPAGSRYQKITKKYSGTQITEIISENIYPIRQEKKKENNLPLFTAAGLVGFWILSKIIIALINNHKPAIK